MCKSLSVRKCKRQRELGTGKWVGGKRVGRWGFLHGDMEELETGAVVWSQAFINFTKQGIDKGKDLLVQ